MSSSTPNGRTNRPAGSIHDENDESLMPTDPPSEWYDIEDDDDMDYEPTTEGDEDDELPDREGDEGEDDGDDTPTELEIVFSTDEPGHDAPADGEGEEDQDGNAQQAGGARVSREEILELLGGQRGLGRYLMRYLVGTQHQPLRSDGEDADEQPGPRSRQPRQSRRDAASEPPNVPSEIGTDLMYSGAYGVRDAYASRAKSIKAKLSPRLLARELALGSIGREKALNSLIAQSLIPSSAADIIIQYNSRCYSGQFSDDGNFFFCCAQDFRVRMYDTSNPYRWRYYKTVVYPYGSWTITDATLSPDNRFLAYSSIRNVVCLAPTDPADDSEPYLLDFAARPSSNRRAASYGSFGIWSIRFSGDGREIVAGTSGHAVHVYDLETRQSIVKIDGHDDDVNAVCYGDKSSPHILYSGSDDFTIKVWDRRSMVDGREAGVFLGHTEGLTYVDSKGDGRYVLSNGKDQTMKLWDLRKMTTKETFDKVRPTLPRSDFDYRYMDYDAAEHDPHPHDSSLVTFRGHRVLKTLIRCHFSPPGSTDSRYVYSGSEDGSVYVYNLDATLAGKVDVLQATGGGAGGAGGAAQREQRARPGPRYGYFLSGREALGACVRDASWHPHAPIIAATSWNGAGMARGTCTVHSWNDGASEDEGEPRMGRSVNERLEDGPSLQESDE